MEWWSQKHRQRELGAFVTFGCAVSDVVGSSARGDFVCESQQNPNTKEEMRLRQSAVGDFERRGLVEASESSAEM